MAECRFHAGATVLAIAGQPQKETLARSGARSRVDVAPSQRCQIDVHIFGVVRSPREPLNRRRSDAHAYDGADSDRGRKRRDKDGSLPQIVGKALEALKAEAAYFTETDGMRTGLFFFEMADSSEIPSAAEPFYMGLGREKSRSRR